MGHVRESPAMEAKAPAEEFENGRIPFRIRIGVTGHRDLEPTAPRELPRTYIVTAPSTRPSCAATTTWTFGGSD
jgi:hypothetical protein